MADPTPAVAPTDAAPAAPVAVATPPPAAPAAAAPPAAAVDPWAGYKAPEGFDPALIKDVVEFAKKEGLDPAAAAKIALREKARAEAEEADFKQLSEKGWLEELTKDPALGGDKIRETMVDVTRALDKLPAAVQTMIKDAGVLYNPVVVRILHAVGASQKEDSFVRPGASPAPQQALSPDERLVSMFATK